jgi:ABC-2 type transport system permease protein
VAAYVSLTYRLSIMRGVGRIEAEVYDSNLRLPPLLDEVDQLRRFSGLLRLLIVRDLTLRYKRSMLGVWWTLLNPLLTTAVMWVVFSNIFRFPTGDVPFIVYLLSGVLLVIFFSQGLNNVGVSVVGSASILTKVYVPPVVFAVSAAVAAGVNFTVSLLPLMVVQLVTGTGIPLTALLVPLPALALLGLVTGLGLLVAATAIRFADTLDLVAILVVLLGYLTPTFYPVSIVPDHFRIFIELNPLYSYLLVFRGLVYEGAFAPWWAWTVMATTSLLTLGLGAYVFSRRWRSLAVML